MREPLLSIIVPVYNTERFLRDCLDSILKQVYWNIEVIVVNDASTDNSRRIILDYQRQDNRVKCIDNPENQGLFKARLRGYEQAHGEYICTVDSDDKVGYDYYRLMMKKAVETGSDIVVSKFTICRYNENYDLLKNVGRTFGNFAIENIDLRDEEILNDYFRTLGKTSHRVLMWNKVYKKSLWDKSYPYLLQLTRHHIMLEDMIYGVVLMSQAKRYVYADTNAFFYSKHALASTGSELDFKTYVKYLSDIFEAFIFLEGFLKQIGRYDDIAAKFMINIKSHWFATWVNQIQNVKTTLSDGQKKYLISALEHLRPRCKKYGDVSFFYGEDTPYDSRLEDLKRLIAKGEIKVVSFDIFDTLVVRPFYTPKDLFVLMDDYFWELNNGNKTPQYFKFSEIRCNAEKSARGKLSNGGFNQEITIDKIYDTLVNNYGIDPIVAGKLKLREKELEIRFCSARKMVKEIFEFAEYCGKKIVATSDMYLDRETISKILEKTEYKVEDIFLSSEIGLTKASGDLYYYMVNRLQLNPCSILHIGDNLKTDGENPQKVGMISWYIPSTMQLFLNEVPDNDGKYSRGKFSICLKRALPKSYLVFWDAKEYYGIRCMIALTANRIFDNAYCGYTWDTDFNMNPYYVGYFALGMHNYGIAHKLLKTSIDNKKSKIIFVARDGYAVKQVYDIISKYYDNAPESDYIYISRKALFPLLFKNSQSLFTIKDFLNVENYTVREIILMLKDILHIDTEKITNDFAWENIILDRKISDDDAYITFIQKLTKYYDEEKNNSYRSELRDYFGSIITKESIFFDIGYSARTQVILSDLLGYSIDAFYIHKLKDNCAVYAEPRGIKVYTYFDYRPSITGKIREVLQSDIIPSCIGYKRNEHGVMEPVFEDDTHTYEGNFVMRRIFEGMCDFARDVFKVFGEFTNKLTFSYNEISFAHELLLHNPTGKDTSMFKNIFFEDDMLLGNTMSVRQIWWNDLKTRQFWNKTTKPDPIVSVPDGRLIEPYYRLKVSGHSVLYIITGSFNMLCMLAHRMKYNPDKTCYVLLSDWRMPLLGCLRASGIFENDKIFIFRDRYLRDSQQSKELLLPDGSEGIANAYAAFQCVENELPFDLRDFDEINIGNDSVILGIYLIAHGINYNYFEDAIGLYSDPYLLQHTIDISFPKTEQYFCKRFGVFGRNPYAIKRYINYNGQKKDFDHDRTVDFNISKIMEQFSPKEIAALLTAYGAERFSAEEGSTYNLLLTAPMVVRYKLTEEQNHNLFVELADLFLMESSTNKLVVKPHPDDSNDYNLLFPDAIVLKKTTISELLPFVLNTTYARALSVMSTSVGNIKSIIKDQILFYMEIKNNNNFEKITQYYAVAKIISELKKAGNCKSIFCAGEISAEMLSNFINKSEMSMNIVVRPYDEYSLGGDRSSVIVCGSISDLGDYKGNSTIISFSAFPGDVKEFVVLHERMRYKETDWVNAHSIYIAGHPSAIKELHRYRFERDMKYSHAILSISFD